MLRARARGERSAGLMHRRGRPGALGARDLGRARSWRAAGDTDAAMGRRLGVHGSTVARALVGVPRPGATGTDAQAATLPVPAAAEPRSAEPRSAEPPAAEPGAAEECPSPRGRPGRHRNDRGRRRTGDRGGRPAGGCVHRVGPDRVRHLPVSLRRGDAAVPLPGHRRRAGDLRHVDRWPGPPLRRPVGADLRALCFALGVGTLEAPSTCAGERPALRSAWR